MTLHRIEPRDPLVLRDGRPNDGRSESRTTDFPMPSTVVGAVRTALGRRQGAFDSGLISSLVNHVKLRGPLGLVGDELLVPAPGDALVLKLADDTLRTRPLRPMTLPEGAKTSLSTDYRLVGLRADENDRAKPFDEQPRFWRWSSFASWLREPKTLDDKATRELLSGGIRGLVREERVHVALGPQNTAEEGKLFAAEGLRVWGHGFDPRSKQDRELDEQNGIERCYDAEVAFAVDLEVNETFPGPLPSGIRPIGGERRLVRCL